MAASGEVNSSYDGPLVRYSRTSGKYGVYPGKKNRSQARVRIDRDPIFGWKRVKLVGKELLEIPKEIFKISDLEVLDLSPERQACLDYRLPFVPKSIRKLNSLRILCLDTNELSSLPPEIALLSRLERLSVSNNRLTSIPDEFSHLRSLRSLHAANNYLRRLPIGIFQLTELEFLDVSDNNLTSIPDEIGFLQNLRTLNLLYNMLESLPDAICDCAKLRSLWIGKNKITRLPKKFGNLFELDWGEEFALSSNVDGNPLEVPPLEICRMGLTAIQEYFGTPVRRRKSGNMSSEDEPDEISSTSRSPDF